MSTNERSLPRLLGGAARDSQQALEPIQAALRGLRYGNVTIIVQDGVIIQVERTEKLRMDRP